MFTGIVQGTARIAAASTTDGVLRLTLDLPTGLGRGLVPGASVSVSGVCLTAVEIVEDRVQFDVIDETLRRTTLGERTTGDLVDVERAASFGDEIGGHLISGHIWGVGEVVEVAREGENTRVRIRPPASARKYILEKGYIGLDGASLTIGQVQPDGAFDVHLIPETLRLTTFDQARPGTRINVEVDAQTQAVVDTVERVLAARGV